MRIIYEYSHLGGKEILKDRYLTHYQEIKEIIQRVKDPGKTKISKEKTMLGERLYPPKIINELFRKEFRKLNWDKIRETYNIQLPDKEEEIKGAFKETDYFKKPIGAEVQFGKYAFMLYDLMKFQYFFNQTKIELGVEIVPTKNLQKQMSTGVSYGEQLIYDLIRLQKHFPSCPVNVILIDF